MAKNEKDKVAEGKASEQTAAKVNQQDSGSADSFAGNLNVRFKVDRAYNKSDGEKGFAQGFEEVSVNQEEAFRLRGENEVDFVDEEGQAAYSDYRTKQSEERVQGVEDEPARQSGSLGMKNGDAFSSNAAPPGDTDVTDPTGSRTGSGTPSLERAQRVSGRRNGL